MTVRVLTGWRGVAVKPETTPFAVLLGSAPRKVRRAYSRRQMHLNARYNGPEPRYERSSAYRPECGTHHRVLPCKRCPVVKETTSNG